MSITGLCRLAGITRQAHYKKHQVRRRQVVAEHQVIGWVRQVRAQHPRMGARKLHHKAAGSGLPQQTKLGRDRLLDVLRRHGLLVQRKPKRTRTTYHDPALPVYRNLLYQLEPTAPHQVWVSDITYVDTQEGSVYLSLITDRVSRQIVGWHAGESLTAQECIKALRIAIEQLPEGRWPIHHSDRGCQYCCHEYVAVLNERNLPISMTETNHCYENSLAERINGILKAEYNLDAKFRSKAQARSAIAQAIDRYNKDRPHTALKMRTPHQVHSQAA
jgi:transposase InsO family protein